MTFTLADFLILLIVAAVCGLIAQAITGYLRGGFVVCTVLGFLGALFGVWIARSMDLPPVFTLRTQSGAFPVFWAIVGAVVILLILAMVRRQHSRRWWR
jgi:uncharacterized membrane protein YeaQ/YmgE (transglycosylase-associated protein family)